MEEIKNEEPKKTEEAKKCHHFKCKCGSTGHKIIGIVIAVIVVMAIFGVGFCAGSRHSKNRVFNFDRNPGCGCRGGANFQVDERGAQGEGNIQNEGGIQNEGATQVRDRQLNRDPRMMRVEPGVQKVQDFPGAQVETLDNGQQIDNPNPVRRVNAPTSITNTTTKPATTK